MPIQNIQNLAEPKKPLGFSYEVFCSAEEYIWELQTVGYSYQVQRQVVRNGFSIKFDSEKEAKDFSSLMENLCDDQGRIFPEVEVPNPVNPGNNLKTKAVEVVEEDNKFEVRIKCSTSEELGQRIRRSNLAKLIERQKDRQQAGTAKTVVATAINVAALGGVPVAGYVAGYAGLALAKAEKKLGWFPGLGFALRNSSRFLLDAGAGILQHGKSFFPSTPTNQSQARKLEAFSDNVGNPNENWNGLNQFTDGITFGVGALLKGPAVITNFIADGLNRLANGPLKTRKANESSSTFWLKKTVVGNALKALAAPFRVPEIAASWLLDSARKSMPNWHRKVDEVFKHTRIGEVAELKRAAPLAPIAVETASSANVILGLKQGLVFDREYYPNSSFGGAFGSKAKYLAELARYEIDGITYKVLGGYDNNNRNNPQIFYKYSGSISNSPPPEVSQQLNAKLNAEAESLKKRCSNQPSLISVNGFDGLFGNQEKTNEKVKNVLEAALQAALSRKLFDKKNPAEQKEVNKDVLPNDFNVKTAENYSFKVGSQVLTYESGTFAFSEKGQNLPINSRQFFNFLGNLSQGKAELKLYGENLPSTSVGSPKVCKLSSKGAPEKVYNILG